jgi:hypothetical protein
VHSHLSAVLHHKFRREKLMKTNRTNNWETKKKLEKKLEKELRVLKKMPLTKPS